MLTEPHYSGIVTGKKSKGVKLKIGIGIEN